MIKNYSYISLSRKKLQGRLRKEKKNTRVIVTHDIDKAHLDILPSPGVMKKETNK